jgi:small subunit ribosomal protein S19
MARSVKKGPFVDDHLMKKVETAKAEGNKKTYKNLVKKIYGSS